MPSARCPTTVEVHVAGASATGDAVSGTDRVPALVRAARPRQWTKGLLVLSAPVAAGRLLEREVLVGAAVAFVCFCVAASAVY